MKDFEALKDIWHGQPVAPELTYKDILSGVKKSKNSFADKLLVETIGMFAVILIFVLIWINSSSLMWTTHLSLLIFILCCCYYLVVQFKDYTSISTSELLLKQPEEYIAYLKRYSKKRYLLNTTKYIVYSTFVGIAIALYLIEIYFSSPLWQIIAGIAGTIIWFVICWYLMQVYIRKEQEKLNEMIRRLETLEKQFLDN